jgi:CheY-like chemotaxis protein
MQRVINILLVEDDFLDQLEVTRTLTKKNIPHRMKIARNGEEALRMLDESTSDIFTGRPDIILLDLNMPKMNGFEFANKIKTDPDFKDIKVFVLTTSEDKQDKIAATEFGASGFITKPLKLESPSSLDAFNLMIDMMNMKAR